MRNGVDQSEPLWFVSLELHVMSAPGRHGWLTGNQVCGPSEEMLRRVRDRGILTAVLVADRAFYGTELDGLVDRWEVCDTRDATVIQARVAALPGQVVALTSLVDSFVGLAAHAAAEIGIGGPTPASPALTRDKSVGRQALDQAGVPDVLWAVCDANDPDIDSPIGYPCVAKPVDGASSWDVELVWDTTQTRELARRHSVRAYPRGVRPQHRLLFEEYVEGPLFSAEGIVDREGNPQILGWSSRIMSDPPHFAELAITFSATPPCAGADAFVRQVLEALGYNSGPFHLELILGEHGLRVVELNPRLIGSGAHYCLERVLGVSAMELVVRNLLNEPWPLFHADGTATQMYIVSDLGGVIDSAPRSNSVTSVPGLVAASMFVGVGDSVQAGARSSSDYIGWVITEGRDEGESVARARAAVAAMTPSITAPRPTAQNRGMVTSGRDVS